MDYLAESLLRQRRFIDAEMILREALGNWQRTNRENWKRYYTESMLGASLAGQKKYQEAEPLLSSGYEGMLALDTKIPVNRRTVLADAKERIAEFDQEQGNAQ